MKKFSILSVLSLCVAALSACGGEPVDATVVHGTWVRDDTDIRSTYVINSDGTFSSTSESTEGFAITITYEGTYAYDGEKLVFTYPELGYDNEYTVTFEGEDMIWDNGKVQMLYEKQ